LSVRVGDDGVGLASIGGAELGERQVLEYPAAAEIEDAEVGPFLESLFDNLELTAVLTAEVLDRNLSGDELVDPDAAQLLQSRL
jgi:hypothetical protein